MKSVLLLVLGLSCSFAFANEVDLPSPQGLNRLETLASWFNQGSSMSFKDFKGFYHGRCFDQKDANKPISTVAGYIEIAGQDDAGPGFTEPLDAKTAIIYANSLVFPADHFEKQTVQANVDYFNGLMKTWRNHLSNYSEMPTLNYHGDWENNGRWDEHFEFKRYNDYIIVKNTAMIRQKYPSVGRVLNPGDVIQMCYYYTKFAE